MNITERERGDKQTTLIQHFTILIVPPVFIIIVIIIIQRRNSLYVGFHFAV